MKRRVVADTNVLLSALLFGGAPALFLDLGFLKEFELVSSPALLEELEEKLLGKFALSSETVSRILLRLQVYSEVVYPRMSLSVVKDDPDDNRVLECALEGKASFVVTGDKHLLRLGNYEAISILTVRQFLDLHRDKE